MVVSINGECPKEAGWFRTENPNLKWMKTRGTMGYTHFRKPPNGMKYNNMTILHNMI